MQLHHEKMGHDADRSNQARASHIRTAFACEWALKVLELMAQDGLLEKYDARAMEAIREENHE